MGRFSFLRCQLILRREHWHFSLPFFPIDMEWCLIICFTQFGASRCEPFRARVTIILATKERLPRRVTWDHAVSMPLCILNSALPDAAQSQLARCTAKTIRTNAVEVLAAHVATGRYATVLPQSLVTYLAQIPDIQAVAISGEGSHANVGFVAPKGGLKTTVSTALLEWSTLPSSWLRYRTFYRCIVGFSPRRADTEAKRASYNDHRNFRSPDRIFEFDRAARPHQPEDQARRSHPLHALTF